MNNQWRFHPVVWTLLVGTVFARGASFMALPFLALYLASTQDVHPILIGLTIGIGPLSGTIGGFVGGYLSDRFGRKKVMLITIFVWASVYIGFALATHIVVFMLLNALNGICRSFFEPTSQALMADATEDSLRKRVFSLRYMAINIGAAGGPLLGVYFSSMSSSLPFLLTSFMYILYGIVLIFMLNRFPVTQVSLSKKLNMRDALLVTVKNRALLLFILGGILVNIGYSQIDSNLPQYLHTSFENGVVLFSRVIALNAILVIILQFPLSVLSEKWPVMRTMTIGSVLFGCGFLVLGFSSTASEVLIAIGIITIGEIFVFPSTSVLIDIIAPSDQRGIYFGAGQFRSIGSFTGPIIGGWLLQELGGQWLFCIIAVIVLTSIFFFLAGNQQVKVMQAQKNAI